VESSGAEWCGVEAEWQVPEASGACRRLVARIGTKLWELELSNTTIFIATP